MSNRSHSNVQAGLDCLMQPRDSMSRPTFVGWLSLAVVGALLTGGIIGCVALGIGDDGVNPPVPGTPTATPPPPSLVTDTPIRAPTDTPAPTATPEDSPTSTPTQLSPPTSTLSVVCPTDPSRWSMIPYDMPGGDQTLYKIDSPCVMEQVAAQER